MVWCIVLSLAALTLGVGVSLLAIYRCVREFQIKIVWDFEVTKTDEGKDDEQPVD